MMRDALWVAVVACSVGCAVDGSGRDDGGSATDPGEVTTIGDTKGGPGETDTAPSTASASDTEGPGSGPGSDSAESGSSGEPTCDGPDEDGDGVCDEQDNCPDVPNPDQAVSEGNPLGNACMWPNDESRASSDPWIAEHHDDLRRMAPRFLAINFANGIGLGGNDNVDGGPVDQTMLETKAQGFLDAMRESSRFHGYEDPSAEPFLDPQLVGVVDLQDGNGHANSDAFPRGATDEQGRPLVGYWRLFEPSFADRLGFYDEALGRNLTLGELVERGEVHEVLMMANQVDGTPVNPPGQVTLHILEVAFVAQAYDASLAPIPGAFVKNGVAFELQGSEDPGAFIDNSMPWSAIGRSLRIYFLNVSRGSGCLQHSLGHEFEFRYNESRIYAPGQPWHEASVNPYMQPRFRAFADFDMAQRYGAPFASLYAGGDDYAYGDCAGGVCGSLIAPTMTISNYAPRCGNTHYPPGATHGYDYYPTASVRSGCQGFAVAGGAEAPSDPNVWSTLPVDDDCGGRFLTWWYQNMPGLGATATDEDGGVMRNWWPFMYY